MATAHARGRCYAFPVMDSANTVLRDTTARVGDVVLCHDATLRRDLKLPDELGLVIESKRDRVHVHFPVSGAEPWIPVAVLARVRQPVGADGVPSWMQRAHFLVQSLDTLFVEVAHVAADGCALRVFHGEIELGALDAIRTAMADELEYWRLLPAGLHKLESAIAFRARARADAPVPPPRIPAER